MYLTGLNRQISATKRSYTAEALFNILQLEEQTNSLYQLDELLFKHRHTQEGEVSNYLAE